MPTNYRIDKEPRFGLDRVVVGPGVCHVVPPEAKSTLKELRVLEMLEGAYAAGKAEEALKAPRKQPAKSYLRTGSTWVFACRCRMCGTIHEYCGQERSKQTWAEFMKGLFDRGLNEPHMSFCDTCNTEVIEDLVAYSPKPESEN